MGDEMLASVCELAFDVAKEGSAPSAMKNYLYLAQRPPRAYSVAQRALEEDTSFRARVADRATIENVGEAGYLWLHRPVGWEQRFSDLNAGVESISSESSGETPLAERPPMPTAPTNAAPTNAAPSADGQQLPPQPTPATQIPSAAPVEAPEPARAAGASSTVSSIENELSSLRGLVDRLADERQNVRSSVTELEVELETRRAENIEMFTKLSALRNELTTVQSSESTILLDRDRALVRVTELEADVARLTSEVERLSAEADGSSSEHSAALTDLATVSSERDSLREELAAVKADHTTEIDRLATVRAELDGVVEQREILKGELDAVTTDRNSLTGQFNEVLADRDQLQIKLDSANADLGELHSQLATVEGERSELAALLPEMDELRADNTELASRLSVAEQARVDLEGQLGDVSEKWKTATRQLAVFENVNSQLDAAVSERNALEDQLSRTNDALSELNDRIGTSHDQIRAELTTIESTFGEAQSIPQAADSSAPVAAVVDVPEVDVPEVDVPEVDVPEVGVPAIDGVDDLGVPSFGDGVDFDATDTSAPEIDDSVTDVDSDEENFFDGKGIEMDPTTLGGRTIGDMFGGTDSSIDADLANLDRDQTLNGNTTGDAAGLDELLDAAADEPLPNVATAADPSTDEPIADVPVVAAPIPDATPDATPAMASSRRLLSIPTGLDDVSFARQVVESPDVILLIDGDGAAGLGWPHLDVATRRGALVDYLGTLTAETGAAADVVFARPVGDEDALPVSRAVRVRIADASVADSPIFASIVDGYPQEWPIAIVTNEPTLLAQASKLEATALSNDQLLDLFLDLNSEG